MPYVVRDENGCVISVLAEPSEMDQDRLDASDAEIRSFFSQEDAAKELQEVLVASDLSFVRVLEDLISALLEKGVITLTDLPEAAQGKILQRQGIRERIISLGSLIGDAKADEEFII